MERPEDKTILVVDDEPDVRRYLATVLEDAGFRVVTAADGEEALERVRERRPDFISLDLVMPRKSGQKLLFELRRDPELARIPVLIVTAHARDESGRSDLLQALGQGVMSGPGTYLEKPIDRRSYLRSVQRALGLPESAATEDRLSLRDELEQGLQGASNDALRRALEALKEHGS